MKILTLILLATLLLRCSTQNSSGTSATAPDLRAWLADNTSIRSNIKLENTTVTTFYFGGALSELAYDGWTEADKLALDESFQRAWKNLYGSGWFNTTPTEEEFSMPLRCEYCEGRLITVPANGPFTVIPEALSKRAYIAYVAHSLAVEIGGGVNWSILSSADAELHHFFNSRSMMHRLSGTTDFFFGEPGGGGDQRIKYLGRASPATPIYVYRWLEDNGLLKSTKEETIHAVLDWFRGAVHFYNSATYQNMQDHWGYPSQPSVFHVISGTIRATETERRHWTAGCHGTAGFIKSVLKAVNIPAQPLFTCGHAQLYFPSIDRYLDHGDNPYNSTVIDQPEKSIAGILIDQATHTTRFTATPDYIPNGNPECVFIGQAATDF